jgi:hypothetical protein
VTTHTTTCPATASTTANVRDDRAVVAVAWPTGRPIYAYTVDEIAEGVDVYTRYLKARRGAQAGERDA